MLPGPIRGCALAAGAFFVKDRKAGPLPGRNFPRRGLDPCRPPCHKPLVPVYAIHCIDKPLQQELRAATRAAHLAYLEAALAHVVVAGPLLDDDGRPIGSMLLMDFADRKEAVAFAAEDPYAKAGLFASVAVTPWRQVYPKPA